MNWGKFQEPVCCMHLAGAVVASWTVTQAVSGSNNLFNFLKFLQTARDGNVFRSICHSVRRGGEEDGGLPRGDLPPVGLPLVGVCLW